MTMRDFVGHVAFTLATGFIGGLMRDGIKAKVRNEIEKALKLPQSYPDAT